MERIEQRLPVCTVNTEHLTLGRLPLVALKTERYFLGIHANPAFPPKHYTLIARKRNRFSRLYPNRTSRIGGSFG